MRTQLLQLLETLTILETETTTGFQISETYPKALLTRHVRQIFVTNSNI